MDRSQSNWSSSHHSTGSIVQDLIYGLQSLVRSEIHLARAELQMTAKGAGQHVVLAIVFGVLALLGTMPFLAFLVIGLGKLLGENYWLSSLIISLICIGVGGVFGARYAKKLTQQDFSLPHTRESVQEEREVMKEKLHEVTETIQRRAS